jgi:leucyl-tRNA synthetase
VALTDQWYLVYGEADWQKIVYDHIHSPAFSAYHEKNMEKFDFVLGWLKEWACSRLFGLGTLLPWDQKWVIESLSDSTVYMAYYTIAHHIHGSVSNLTGVNNEQHLEAAMFSDEVFDYIFLAKTRPAVVPAALDAVLDSMKSEFEYWYPMDLRVSAKDLIPNHLTMSLYNHVEIWKDRPELWPRGIYCNGHVMVDAEKMSKSKGNFLMLLGCVEEYSADATRFALADAGRY